MRQEHKQTGNKYMRKVEWQNRNCFTCRKRRQSKNSHGWWWQSSSLYYPAI